MGPVRRIGPDLNGAVTYATCSGGEFVANAADGMKMTRAAAVFLEIFTEIKNEVVDCAGGRIHVISPYYLQYLLARNYFALVLYKQFKQGCFFFAQLLPGALAVYGLVRGKVDSELPEFVGCLLYTSPSPRD